jgi:hypothetical protein
MGARIQSAAGVCLLLFGVASSFFFLHIFLRVGFPQLQDGAKGVVYAWLFTISVPLPLTTGVALFWGIRSWRPFVGWWLLAMAVLALGSLLWFLPPYQGWPFTFIVGSAVCVLPPILCSLFLLLWTKSRSTNTGRHNHPLDDDQS